MTGRTVGIDARTLHVLIEMNSADLRIGAVNDALDLAELAGPAGATFTICGPLSNTFRREAGRRGAATVVTSSRTFSRRELPLYALDVLRWIARLRRIAPDIVHINYAGYGPSIACAARMCGVPVVARPGPYVTGNLSNRWVDAYVANCRAHADELFASPLADRVVVAGDLYRPDRVRTTVVSDRPLPLKSAEVVRAVFLGQLVERKGIHILIEAFARVRSGAELLIVGGDWSAPGYPQRLKRVARDAGAGAHIHLENHRDDIGAILQSADIFVLPSLSEARPRSIIEAMSAGVPVVASAAGGIPSLVRHESTGLLVPPGDVDRLAGALHRLIRSPQLRRRLGDAGRRFVAQACRPERTAFEYLSLYRRLIARRAATASEMAVVADAGS